MVTPGVALNEEVLEQKQNNYLAAYYSDGKQVDLPFWIFPPVIFG